VQHAVTLKDLHSYYVN